MRLTKLFKKKAHLVKSKTSPLMITLLRGLHKEGSYASVVSSCNQALTTDFTNTELYLIRGLAKYRLGDLIGAGQDLSKAASSVESNSL